MATFIKTMCSRQVNNSLPLDLDGNIDEPEGSRPG